MAEPPRSGSAEALEDPAYRAAVVDLLGVIAYGEVSAFDRLGARRPERARRSPTGARSREMAAAEFGHFERLCDELRSLGADPFAAMRPFVQAVDAFHARTGSSDWLEGLVTAYVGDGLAADFYAEIAQFVDPRTRAVVLDSLSDAGHSAFVVDRVRAAIEADPRVSGRLALWGRMLVGEALIQAQRVAAEREELTALLSGAVTGDAAPGGPGRTSRTPTGGPSRPRPRRARPALHPVDREPLPANGLAGARRLTGRLTRRWSTRWGSRVRSGSPPDRPTASPARRRPACRAGR